MVHRERKIYAHWYSIERETPGYACCVINPEGLEAFQPEPHWASWRIISTQLNCSFEKFDGANNNKKRIKASINGHLWGNSTGDRWFVVSPHTIPVIGKAFPCHMMTSSNGNIFRVTGPLCGEFTGPGEFPTQRPVTRSFDVLFDLRLNKRLSKQPWGWWFETPSWSLWRQCNDDAIILNAVVSVTSRLYPSIDLINRSMHPTNERRCHDVTPSIIGWTHTQSDSWRISPYRSYCDVGIYKTFRNPLHVYRLVLIRYSNIAMTS